MSFTPDLPGGLTMLMSIGMSGVLIEAPPPVQSRRYEVCMLLPGGWSPIAGMPEEGGILDNRNWPLTCVLNAAILPMRQGRAVQVGDTLVAGDMLAADAGFTALLAAPALSLPKESRAFVLEGVGHILMALFPIFPEEREFRARNGSAALVRLMADAGIGCVADVSRRNLCAAD
jgi:hypothetical protein